MRDQQGHPEGDQRRWVEPGDVVYIPTYGDLRISEVNPLAADTGRGAGGSGLAGGGTEAVGVDSQGMIRRFQIRTGRERMRRVSQGEVQPLPERDRETIRTSAIQPGDRIMTPQGEAVVIAAAQTPCRRAIRAPRR